MIDPIESFCRTHGLPFDAQAAERFTTYLELLEKLNVGMNLIGPLSREAIIDELLIDSLTPAVACAPTGKILDVGTGAGLPGIPLKILYPDLPITFVEPRRKRATFLKICTKRLGLDDVTIHEARIEDVPHDEYQYVISKAFQPPLNWIETASKWLATDGVLVCMTRQTEKEGLLNRARELDLEPKGEHENERAIYVFAPIRR
ncbi:MAG: 16S rRNA (guanine(527)-N(7))-methyltransferase RsmG [Bradymonadaceae bacterium]